MKEVICQQEAERLVDEWAECMDVELPRSTRESIIRTVKKGRIDFDLEAETFAIVLRTPISLENGDTIKMLTLRGLTARENIEITKIKDAGDATMKYLSKSTSQAVGILERLSQKDLLLLGEMISFFL